MISTGAEPRLLLVAAWLMPLSVVPLILAREAPFVRAHALAGTVTGGCCVAALTVGNLLPAWLAIPVAVPTALWLGTCCLRGMFAALEGRPPPRVRWVSGWVAWVEGR
ncbi:MAG: hypothetical protein RL653_1735 [Pseudomonadota bacterium]